MQNVEKQPYRQQNWWEAFISIEAVAAFIMMFAFWYSIPHFDAEPTDNIGESTRGPEIIDKAMNLPPGKLAAEGNLDDAMKEATRLIATKKFDAAANICVGNVYILAGAKEPGLKYLKKAVSLSHRNRYVIENYAERLAEVGATDEAIAQLETLCNADTSWPKPHMELAKLYMDSGRPGEAADQFKIVLAINDRNFAVRKLRGLCLARAGQLKSGLEEYALACAQEAQPGNLPDSIRTILGEAGVKAIDRVNYELQQEVNNHPDNYVPRLRLAQLYQYMNNPSTAKDLLLESRRLQPNNPEIHRTLAVVMKQLGEDNQALSEFAMSVKLEQAAAQQQAQQNGSAAAQQQ